MLHWVLLEQKIVQKQPDQGKDLEKVPLGHIARVRRRRLARVPKTLVRTSAGPKQITQTLDRALQTHQGQMLHQKESEHSRRRPPQ